MISINWTKEEAYAALCLMDFSITGECEKGCPFINEDGCYADMHESNATRKLKEYIRELDEIEK